MSSVLVACVFGFVSRFAACIMEPRRFMINFLIYLLAYPNVRTEPQSDIGRNRGKKMNDPDINLFPALIEGVSTDFQDDVNPSKVFAEKEEPIRPDLTIHWSNWQTSESQPELTEKLVQEEIQRLAHLFSGDH